VQGIQVELLSYAWEPWLPKVW